MSFKRSFLTMVIALVAMFTVTSGVSAEELELLDIDFSTDKTSYEYEDEVTSTITITNQSNRYSAKNLKVQTDLPEDFDLVDQDEDIVVENGQIIWDIEDLERGDSLELTFQTKLKQSILDEVNSETQGSDENKENTNNEETESDEQVASQTDNDNNNSSDISKAEEELTSPQTGDDKSIVKYVIILILSIIAGLFAFITIRKKRIPKSASFLLAIAMLLPTFSVTHAESVANEADLYTATKNFQFTIGDRTYDIGTTITAESHDHYEEIPVTGTVTDADGNLVTNTSLTFTATVYDEQVEEVIETDEEGYFVSRLAKDAIYTVQHDQLSAKIKAIDTNEVEVTNETGNIELGKKLTNGDNHTKLQPSAIYLSDEFVAKISGVSSDLSKVTVDGLVDIQENDLIVIPEIEGYPEGISFVVESIEVNNGQMVLHLAEPELEAIFSEIVGDLSAELTPENFTPAEGITFAENGGPTPFSTFSTQMISPRAASLSNTITLSINNIYRPDDNFAITGEIELSGMVTGDIDWRLGLNPVESMDFNFQGEQKVTANMVVKANKEFEHEIGKFRIPTKIPGVTVEVPFSLVSEVGGNVNYSITAGMRQNIGLAYERGSGMRTYPEEKITPYFHPNNINGTGEAGIGVKLAGVGKALGWELVGLDVSGGFKGSATTSVLGPDGMFQCATAAVNFERTLGLEAPIFKWNAEMDLGRPISIWSDSLWGDCVNQIQVNPDAIELEPEQTKSVTITARNNQNEAEINDSDKINFNISEPNKIEIIQETNRVDIKATDQANDGDVITVEVVYDQNGDAISDELTVKIVDNRPKGELVGSVSDAVSGDALHDATVKVYQGDDLVTEVKTTENGSYKANLAPGDYKIEVSYPDYITDTSRIKITSTETTTYDAKLELVGNEFGGIGTVKGQITNAVNGAGIEDLTIEIRKGKNNTTGEVVETVTTDRNGNYEVELNGGNYTILLSKEGYITTHANILAIGGETKTNQNATISPDGVVDENLRIVLTWGSDPRDLDSHLTGPKADDGRFHVYYGKRNYEDEANDVNLDRDDVNSYGPETVTVINRIQEGTYTYAVHNYTGRYLNENNEFALSNSNAKVEVYRADTLLATYNVPLDQAGNSWRVFEIRNGEIVPINTVETIDTWRTPDSFAPVN